MKRLLLVLTILCSTFLLIACSNQFSYVLLANTGGTVSGSISGTYAKGTTLSCGAQADEGFYFDGWYLNNKLVSTENPYNFTLTKNSQMVGRFSYTEYNIIYHLGSQGTLGPNSPLTFTINSNFDLENAVANTGYLFNGWYSESNFVHQITHISRGTNHDVELWAKYSQTNAFEQLWLSYYPNMTPPPHLNFFEVLEPSPTPPASNYQFMAGGLATVQEFNQWINSVGGIDMTSVMLSAMETQLQSILPGFAFPDGYDIGIKYYVTNFGTGPMAIYIEDDMEETVAAFLASLPAEQRALVEILFAGLTNGIDLSVANYSVVG
ncbi:MAG: InlB B-repeat-containing protein [Acholeplasmatales bacterium]|jgi:uncharacterized repeat protein (TIGR02543 family)|nr:InlB B-repeat-containing protein [Acholeplasmatales bacterium]